MGSLLNQFTPDDGSQDVTANYGSSQPLPQQQATAPQYQGGLTPFGQRSPQDQIMSIAGLLQAGGLPYDKAVAQASQMAQQQAAGAGKQFELHQAQQKQLALQALGQAKDPHVANQILYSGVFSPEEITKLSELSGGAQQKVISGANGLKYTQSVDPSTGQPRLDLIPGQVEKPQITPAEARINNTKIVKLAEAANTAQTENRYLDDAEKYFQQYDKNESNSLLGSPGSLGSKLANNFKPAENLLLNNQGLSAKQEIDKISGLMFQNRVVGAGQNATDVFKEQVKKSLPTIELTPDARQELITTKRRENMALLTRSKFLSEWYKQNSKDITGAEDAYQSYIDGQDLVDKDGQVNKQLLKDIPKVVTEFIGTSSQPLKDNKVPIGGGAPSDNVDASFADSTGTPSGQGSVSSGKRSIRDLSEEELMAIAKGR